MIRRNLGLLLGLACVVCLLEGAALPQSRSYESFAEWREACGRLPSNRDLKGKIPRGDTLPLPTFAPLSGLLDQFFSLCRTGTLAQATLWVGAAPSKAEFFNTERSYFVRPTIPFQPFAQKLVVPADTEVILRGDLHGDIRSLNAMLDWLNRSNYLTGFTVSRTNAYLVFLGDYTDRGVYGVEVIYTLLRLKLANPDRVFFTRGNHEDVSLAAGYGFLDEGITKYGHAFDARKVCRLYDFLPVVLYLGCGTNFIQCCHGGMEPGYSPTGLLSASDSIRFQLLGPLRQRQFLQSNTNRMGFLDPTSRGVAAQYYQDFVPTEPTKPSLIGFMWNDFTQVQGQPQFEFDVGRGFVYGERATQFVLQQAVTNGFALRAVFRAHQHSSVLNPMMNRLIASGGVFRHWQATDATAFLDTPAAKLRQHLDHLDERTIPDGSAWTFNVAPDSAYGAGCGFDFDAFGILKVNGDFKDWRLRVVNVAGKLSTMPP